MWGLRPWNVWSQTRVTGTKTDDEETEETEETEKYAISVAISGIEVIKMIDLETEQMDATIGLGDELNTLSGAIRKLVVLEKS